MAVTQLYKRFTRLDSLIKYAMNGDKTEEMKYVSGINCLPETAYEEMENTKSRFNKGKEKIIGYHLIQSFAGDDNLTPEQAHQIGLEYANEVFGKDFEIVVATHLNTDNLHNHIVINSVSVKTGKKFYDNYASRDYIRASSDFICKFHNLSVIDKPWKRKGYYKKFAKENPYMQMVKRDVDRCLEQAWSKKDFTIKMSMLGYNCAYNDELGLVVYDETKERTIHLRQFFGEDYSATRVIERILDYKSEDFCKTKYSRRYKMSKDEYMRMLEIKRKKEMQKLPLLYLLFCLLLKIDPLPAKIDFENTKIPITKEMKIELKYMSGLSRQAVLLSENKISSLDDLNVFRTRLENEVRDLKGRRENLQRKKKRSKNVDDIKNFDIELKALAPKIKRLNEDIQNCYKIEKRTILWEQEVNNVTHKEKRKQFEKNIYKNIHR